LVNALKTKKLELEICLIVIVVGRHGVRPTPAQQSWAALGNMGRTRRHVSGNYFSRLISVYPFPFVLSG